MYEVWCTLYVILMWPLKLLYLRKTFRKKKNKKNHWMNFYCIRYTNTTHIRMMFVPELNVVSKYTIKGINLKFKLSYKLQLHIELNFYIICFLFISTFYPTTDESVSLAFYIQWNEVFGIVASLYEAPHQFASQLNWTRCEYHSATQMLFTITITI